MDTKHNIDIKISNEFIEQVVDTICCPHSQLIGLSNKITVQIPQKILTIIKKCPNITNSGIDTIWRKSLLSISDTLNNLPYYHKMECLNILKDTEDNCIMSAIINVMKCIQAFNKINNLSQDISITDVETAMSIILDKDLIGEIENINDLSNESDRELIGYILKTELNISRNDIDGITRLLLGALEVVKSYPMSYESKLSKINFFSKID